MTGRVARLPYHVDSDQRQQDECNPVVDIGDQGLKRASEKIADQRHDGLKSTEIESGNQQMFGLNLSYGKALTDGNSKCIHRQPDCNNK